MSLEKSMGRRAPVVMSFIGFAFCSFASSFAEGSSYAEDSTPSGEAIHDTCTAGAGGAALYVHVENIRSIEGNLRVQAYSDNPKEFLEKGTKLLRVDTPVLSQDKQSVCVQMPGPGTYAFVVMHDRNANGKADFFSEGFGFTNNPKLGLGPPDAEKVMFAVSEGVTDTNVQLKYILGSDSEKKAKRRKLRRR